MIEPDNSRRRFLILAAAGTGLLFDMPAAGQLAHAAEENKDQQEVSPGEDLMREHGVLQRVLLIYGEGIRRIEANEDLPPAALADAAGIIRGFIEDYHEKLEEDFLFPRFRKANQQLDLVDVLAQQHQAGRRVTDLTLALAAPQAIRNPELRPKLADSLRQFIRMYNPHQAREDTLLFPAFHNLVTPREYRALGEAFEKKEHQLFGQDGFDKMVDKVAAIEKTLGIYDLAQFTPKL